MIAEERARGLRDHGGKTTRPQVGDKRLDRQGRPIRRRTAAHHGPVHRLMPGVVGNPGIVDVDRDALRRDRVTPRGDAEAEHSRRTVPPEQAFELTTGCAEDARQHGTNDPSACHLTLVPRQRDLARGIAAHATERLEAGEKNNFRSRRSGHGQKR